MPDYPSLAQAIRSPDEYYVREYRHGVWRGFVTDIDDPEGRGRVRVWIPQIHAVNAKSTVPWAEPAFTFGGGSGYGLVAIPPVDSTVWVAFEQGYIGRPVWIGTWYGAAERPADHVPADTFIWQSPGGHRLVLDDAAPRIRVAHENGDQEILLDDSTLTIRNKASQDSLVMNSSSCVITQGGNTVTLTKGGALTISVTGNATITAGGNLTATAAGSATVTAATTVDVTATTGPVTITTATATTLTATTGPVTLVTAGNILLGAGAIEALVLGTAFKTLFDAHVHSSSGSGPPTTTMTPGVHLSATVFTKP